MIIESYLVEFFEDIWSKLACLRLLDYKSDVEITFGVITIEKWHSFALDGLSIPIEDNFTVFGGDFQRTS